MISYGINDLVDIDLADMSSLSNYNKKYEIFIVTDRYCKDSVPVYKLTDMKHRLIDGIFYAPELQAVSKKDVWKIERILRKKGNQVLVRWKGFGQDFDSWIPKSSVQNIVHKK